MIVSAVSLWKKIDNTLPLSTEEKVVDCPFLGAKKTEVSFNGHLVLDGQVRIFARFYRPEGGDKVPAILLLPDFHSSLRKEEELAEYFTQKGYAVLIPDYQGEREEKNGETHTVYPPSLAHANAKNAELYHLDEDGDAEKTCWFEWLYVSVYAIEYLKSRDDIGAIGGVGVRTGGEILWKAMLSPDLKCGVPINAAGWKAYFNYDKFADASERNMSDERHGYIAGIESQSYAPFVKCPVLMLCSLYDYAFDYDRAYDTFTRIGVKDGSAMVYSPDCGPCIGPLALKDMELFLERNLKGRAIFIPSPVNLTMKEEGDDLVYELNLDEGGIVEEVGICYAETGEEVESAFREWKTILRVNGNGAQGEKTSVRVQPYKGANYAFAYAYARYINGFKVASKIVAKKLEKEDYAVKNRVVYAGDSLDEFTVADHESVARGGIFVQSSALPKFVKGYGNIVGAYSKAGIRTYKIGTPQFLADEGAMLKFDVYAQKDVPITVTVEVPLRGAHFKKYSTTINVEGGGRWKRIIVKASECKDEEQATPLASFSEGMALSFTSESDEEYTITNILWL